MKPERYLLDVSPAKSHATTKEESHHCECGKEIKADSFIVHAHCDDCLAGMDEELENKMMQHGHAGGWPIYWTGAEFGQRDHERFTYFARERWVRIKGTVGTFHGFRKWPVTWVHVGRHNIARWQYRLNWRMPDGTLWAGTVYGDNTELVRNVRRIQG